jgi:hypothetical protein
MRQSSLRYAVYVGSISAIYAIVITAAAVSVSSTVSAVLDIAVVFTVSTAAVYVASAASAILDVATVFPISTAAVSTASAVSTVFTTTTTISVSSASAADRSPHSVNLVRPWSYYPMAPFPQLGMNIWMETDRVGNDGDQQR